jgi:hypothetical protein
VDDLEDLLLDAVRVRLVLHQPQPRGVLVGLAEQPLARAEQEREDQLTPSATKAVTMRLPMVGRVRQV